VVRTVFLLRYLSDASLREQITASTNKVEAYNGFAKWLNFGGEGVIEAIAFEEQEKRLKYNHLVANAVAIQNVIDLTRAVRALLQEGYPIRREDLAALSPYQTGHLKRFGDYTLSAQAPEPFDGELVTPFLLEGKDVGDQLLGRDETFSEEAQHPRKRLAGPDRGDDLLFLVEESVWLDLERCPRYRLPRQYDPAAEARAAQRRLQCLAAAHHLQRCAEPAATR